jgi:hypothetical protein
VLPRGQVKAEKNGPQNHQLFSPTPFLAAVLSQLGPKGVFVIFCPSHTLCHMCIVWARKGKNMLADSYSAQGIQDDSFFVYTLFILTTF